jgi:predicted secreted protein
MAIAGVGTEFRRWTAPSWVAIAEINNISGPTMSRETIDTTALDTVGGYRTFITGFRDAGTVSFSMNFTRTGYETMKDDFESATVQQYEIVLPDDENTTLEFSGLVTECPLDIPPDDKVTADITIKITGSVTINSGSGS